MMKLKDLKTMGAALPAATDGGDPNVPGNRKEREAADAIKKKEDWMKRHLAGETDQAKVEMKKLAEVKARREAAKVKREGEGKAAGWVEERVVESSDESSDEDSDSDNELSSRMTKAPPVGAGGQKVAKGKNGEPISLGAMTKETAEKKKKAALATLDSDSDDDGDLPALNNMEMKKMNPNDLKEHLKARNQSVQGAKKDLLKRLMDFEAARKK